MDAKKKLFRILLALPLLTFFTTYVMAQSGFEMVENKNEKRVDILFNGEPFTSYIYPDDLMKPVLYPLRTKKGTLITRGWPLDPRPGERVDHPHHVGLWLNYGNINGLDFWNNSTAIPAEKKKNYGTIKHVSVNKMESNKDRAMLQVTKNWQAPEGNTILKENTQYLFTEKGPLREIEINTKLTAMEQEVSFEDNKEGLIGIRLARELEHPSDKPEIFTDAGGNPTQVAEMNNERVTGKYRSSEGIEGDNVWGTRGKWVNLMGRIENEPISLVILDNPKNVGYPTYWHARGYGLFAANPLGQKEFSKGRETLNFKLKAGQSVEFKYRILISSGETLSDQQINKEFESFSNK
ncbi:DUF6807 domain-containing protein [Sphingobacterium endophyticum]|uniref:DUF6807 domain-containing protein n=1 Tax=Sphingobacterium endophyticum TaxID=2546448 RepID=UPI0012E1685E|nr:PmoA family protein [Sphingobacterium endophyticum]